MQHTVYPSAVDTHTIIDTQHQGMPIAAFDYPKGWHAQSMALWNWANPNNLVLIFGRVWNPQGSEVVESFPREQYYWLGYSSGMFDRPGSISLPSEVPAASALLHYVIPRYRSSRENLRILSVVPIPDLAQRLNNQEMMQLGAEGVSARVRYMEQGKEIEEEFFALKYVQPHAGGQQNWGLSAIFSARAEREQVAAARDVAFHIAQSTRPNPQWQAMFSQIAYQLNARQIDALAMQQRTLQIMQGQEQTALSNYLDWSRQTQNAVTNARWASGERQIHQFGDLMMGRTPHADPLSQFGNPHYDYSHAQYVYTDGQGGWLYTDDTNIDPNMNSDRTWTLATPHTR